MLSQILKAKKEEVKQLQMPAPCKFQHFSLKQSLISAKNNIGLIAEVKKASPSKGVIRHDFDPVAIAKDYEKAGASAISVLTDQYFFQGHHKYLSEIKQHTRIPVLRKDFIIDSKQVLESKRIGADAILLIGEALEPSRLYDLYQNARELGLEVLVEIHALSTLENILAIFTPEIIGVNNRNLKTFQTDLTQTEKISPYVPEGSVFISESGIVSHEDILRVKKTGAKGVLVGEALMKNTDISKGVEELLRGSII
ncbi:MAG: indole-3-glycerol phosphate synthase TrpC [Bacillaceae bacterium]|nr:indole-3-glycerol phosphate synthase TrpC [Bacillaceae bacterium]